MKLRNLFLTALALTLPLAGAKAQPVVSGATVSIYASVPDPITLSFAPDGTLYVGYNPEATYNAFKIHRVAPGGSPVTPFGNAGIVDPDAVIVDVAGVVSGTTGAVIVGGYSDPVQGKISKITPDGTVSTLFGPTATYWNPSAFLFDPAGRLLFSDGSGTNVMVTTGGTPAILLSTDRPYCMAADAAGRLAITTADNWLRLYSLAGVLSNATFAVIGASSPLAAGPGGAWGTDLYAVSTNGNLLRLDLAGNATVVGSGFGTINYLVFGPGGALYASDFAGDRIWRIAPVMGIPTPAGLISWWRGEGNAADETGAHPGTPVGGLGYAPGQVGQAFVLNGQNAAVALGTWFNLQQFTLSFWVRPNASQGQYADLLDNVHSDNRSWAIQYDNASDATRSYWHWGTSVPSGGGSVPFSLSHQVWQHWVITLATNGIQRLYLNGTLAGSTTNTAAIPYDGSQYFNLGKHQLYGRHFNGWVDELMCFSRPLTPDEVASLYYCQGGPLQLNIQPAPGAVLLSWPASATSFGLVSRANLTAGVWESVTNAPSLNGDRKEVLLPANTPAQRFFRLAR